MRNGWRWLAVVFLTGLFALQIYRAATLSITVDEARVFKDFIHPDPAVLLARYDAAHHVLQTYLSWFFAKRWGGSELVLRIPALLAAIAYFGFVYRFSARLFGGYPPAAIAGILVLAANPLVLDHLALARGYGVALALFAWAVWFALEDRLFAAGVLSGLSVASNLTFLVPALALAVAVFAFTRRRRAMLLEYVAPGSLICAFIIVLPVLHATPGHFYFGTPDFSRMFTSLVDASLDRRYWGAPVRLLGVVLGLVALAVAAGALGRKCREARLLSLTLFLSLAATVAIHVVLNTPYPFFRTGLWLIFLMTAAALAAGREWPRAAMGIALVTGALYLTQYDPHFVQEWRGTAAVKRYMKAIRDREAGSGRTVLVSGGADFKFPTDYYRIRLRMESMQEMPFESPVGGADYYLFDGPLRHDMMRQWNATLIEDDQRCLCLLAAR
jgi:hypothetical protein